MSAPANPSASSSPANGGPALAPNWKATKDANGQVYYYNRVTRETRWDPPLAQSSSTAASASSPPAAQSSLPNNHTTPQSAAASSSAQPSVQHTSSSLSRHQSVEGSPSLSRAANPSDRVGTLSRSGHSQIDTSLSSPGTGGASNVSALPPPPPDLPEAGTARKRVADLAQAFAQKSTTPAPPTGNKIATGASRKWAGSNHQLADQSTKRGSVYSSIHELSGPPDANNATSSHIDSSKPVPAPTLSGPHLPAPPAAADPPPPPTQPAPPAPPANEPAPPANEPDPPLPPPPPPVDPETLDSTPAPLPPPPPTEPADQSHPQQRPAPHPRTYSVSHVESSTAASTAPAQASAGWQAHPRSMTISGGSAGSSRLPAFPPAAIETTFENEGHGDQPLQRSKPPSPKKLRESTMSGFLVDLDKKLASPQGNAMVAASQAAAAAAASSMGDTETDAESNQRKSGVPSLSVAPPSATGAASTPASGLSSTAGGQSPISSPISPSPSAYNEFPSSPAESTDSVPTNEPARESGGFGGLLRRARSPSFSKPNKKDKSSKSKHSSPNDDSVSCSSMDHLSMSQPDSPNLAPRLPTSLAENTKPDKARPKSLVLNSLGIGNSSSSSSSSANDQASISSSNPSIAAPTPNPSPASGNSAASNSGSKGALSWLFKKSSDKSSSSSASTSPHSPPTSPDTAAHIFGGSLSVLGAAGVHPLVTQCMAIVDERGPRIEGIYRLSGNAAAIQRHKAAWQQAALAGGATPDVSAFDVNVVSGTLKLFLRELQDPVLTCDMYPEWVLAGKMEPGAARAGVIRGLIARLPQAHQDVLRVLMWHLNALSRFADHTKMDTSNFAIVFGPTLVRPRVESMETMVNTEPQNSVVAEMIANVADYFEPLGGDEEDEQEEAVAPVAPAIAAGGATDALGNEPPRSPTGKFRPPKGAMLVMPASPVGLPPKLPDLMPISPIDSPVGSREASGASGMGM